MKSSSTCSASSKGVKNCCGATPGFFFFGFVNNDGPFVDYASFVFCSPNISSESSLTSPRISSSFSYGKFEIFGRSFFGLGVRDGLLSGLVDESGLEFSTIALYKVI